MKTFWTSLLALSTAICCGTVSRAAMMELTEEGIRFEAAPTASYVLSYPELVNGGKKSARIQDRKLDGRKATLTYEGGGRAELVLGADELVISLADVPPDTKLLHATMKLPTAQHVGLEWSIGPASGELPAEKPAKPFLFQGNASSLSFTKAGAKLALRVPDYSYHQLQDNREWGADLFQWQVWMPFYPDQPRCVIRLGEATAAPAPAKPVITRARVREEAAPGPETGATKVMKWKDGKQAVFMLEFDDSCETDIRNVIPELKKRGMVGTFYINPGNGPFKNRQVAWEKEVPAAGMEMGNHTFTHSHALSVADFEEELNRCTAVINKCYPDRKQYRLISYGPPGGIPKEKWLVTPDEVKASLKKLNLVERPSFYGPPIHMQGAEAVMKIVDQALAQGEMGHLDFHGVGGDWLVTPMDWFLPLLDKLEANRDLLWITDPISWHKYLTERKAADIKVLAADARQIRLQLTSDADPMLYDLPLTLATRLPAGWTTCVVKQGGKTRAVSITGGIARYDAMPGAGDITIASP